MNKSQIEILSESVEQTIKLGRIIGANIDVGGQVIALIGQLGSGKTHLIKGIALGLEITDAEAVTSPTFTLMNEYEGRFTLYHIDAYRLENAGELAALGFDEICCGPSVIVVEWADKVHSLVDEYNPVQIRLEHKGETQRLIKMDNLPENILYRMNENG